MIYFSSLIHSWYDRGRIRLWRICYVQKALHKSQWISSDLLNWPLHTIDCGNLFWLFSLFTTLEQNLESAPPSQLPLRWFIVLCMLVSPERKITTAFPFQQQPCDETTQKHLYHVPLGMLITHELLPKWTENKEVLCCLRDEVNLPPPINPLKSLPVQKIFENYALGSPQRLPHSNIPVITHCELTVIKFKPNKYNNRRIESLNLKSRRKFIFAINTNKDILMAKCSRSPDVGTTPWMYPNC